MSKKRNRDVQKTKQRCPKNEIAWFDFLITYSQLNKFISEMRLHEIRLMNRAQKFYIQFTKLVLNKYVN